MRYIARLPVVVLLAMLACPLVAPRVGVAETFPRTMPLQAAVTQAGTAITDSALGRWVTALAADSLRDRRTPSAALERAARYVAAQFQALGLHAGVRNVDRVDVPPTDWIQRYPLPGRTVQVNYAKSHLGFDYTLQRAGHNVVAEGRGLLRRQVVVPFALGYFLIPEVPESRGWAAFVWGVERTTGAVLTGRPTSPFLAQADLTGKTILYLPPADLDAASRQAIVEQLYPRSRGVVVLLDSATSEWAQAQTGAAARPLQLIDTYLLDRMDESARRWAMAMPLQAFRGLLAAAGVDVAAAVRAETAAVHDLPTLEVEFTPLLADTEAVAIATAPNVVGMLEGSDSIRKSSCLIIVAPLDRRDSVVARSTGLSEGHTLNLAGLLALARAFTQLAVPPPVSVVFLAASGGGPGQAFWGSRYYGARNEFNGCEPLATLTLGLTAGEPSSGAAPSGDTVALAGLREVRLVPSPAWLPAQYPELQLTIVDGDTVWRTRSDAAAFARQLYPSLGVQARVPTLERAVRLVRSAFYLGYQLAWASEPPQWSDGLRQRLVGEP